MLDGAWWPHSTDLMAELPALVRALDTRWGPVTHLMLGAGASAIHPLRVTVDSRKIRLGWFVSQSPALLIATCNNWERTDLLIIPSTAARDVAERAMSCAAEAATMLRAPSLLTATHLPVQQRDVDAQHAWDNEGGQINEPAALTHRPGAPS